MALMSYFFLVWYKNRNLKLLIISALLGFLLGFEHLFDLITINVTIIFFLIIEFSKNRKIEWERIKHLVYYGLITCIPFIYTYWMFTNPMYNQWNNQNILNTPEIHQVLFGYGLLFIGYLVVLYFTLKRKIKYNSKIVYLLTWITVVLFLVYSPLNIQRRFFEGVHIAYGIIFSYVLFKILPKYIGKKRKGFVFLLLFLLTIPTNIIIYYNQIEKIDNGQGHYPYSTSNYLEIEEYQAIKWLRDNSEKNSVIIAPYNIGNHIPGSMNRKVYIGHWAQTINLEQKKQKLEEGNVNINKEKYYWNTNIDKKYDNIVFQNSKVIITK
jgi:hypothetical protein